MIRFCEFNLLKRHLKLLNSKDEARSCRLFRQGVVLTHGAKVPFLFSHLLLTRAIFQAVLSILLQQLP
jgi:hypothetical protein